MNKNSIKLVAAIMAAIVTIGLAIYGGVLVATRDRSQEIRVVTNYDSSVTVSYQGPARVTLVVNPQQETVPYVFMEEETVEETTTEEVVNSYSSEEINELAEIIMLEAEGESFECKKWVCSVILNRVAHRDFPDNIHDVIWDGDQFTPTFDGRWGTVTPNSDCFAAIDEVLKNGVCTDALFFEAQPDGVSNWHNRNLEFIQKLSKTKFYR